MRRALGLGTKSVVPGSLGHGFHRSGGSFGLPWLLTSRPPANLSSAVDAGGFVGVDMGLARLRDRAPLVCALRTSLVRYDGTALLHWQHADTSPAPRWLQMSHPDATLEVVDLAACPDLNGTHQQLFVATAHDGLQSWTWQPDSAGVSRWMPWPQLPLTTTPVALTCWSLGAGHQQVVVAGADGVLVSLRRERWGEWSDQMVIGAVPSVSALDSVVGSDGAVEGAGRRLHGRLGRRAELEP